MNIKKILFTALAVITVGSKAAEQKQEPKPGHTLSQILYLNGVSEDPALLDNFTRVTNNPPVIGQGRSGWSLLEIADPRNFSVPAGFPPLFRDEQKKINLTPSVKTHKKMFLFDENASEFLQNIGENTGFDSKKVNSFNPFDADADLKNSVSTEIQVLKGQIESDNKKFDTSNPFYSSDDSSDDENDYLDVQEVLAKVTLTPVVGSEDKRAVRYTSETTKDVTSEEDLFAVPAQLLGSQFLVLADRYQRQATSNIPINTTEGMLVVPSTNLSRKAPVVAVRHQQQSSATTHFSFPHSLYSRSIAQEVDRELEEAAFPNGRRPQKYTSETTKDVTNDEDFFAVPAQLLGSQFSSLAAHYQEETTSRIRVSTEGIFDVVPAQVFNSHPQQQTSADSTDSIPVIEEPIHEARESALSRYDAMMAKLAKK